MSTSKQTKAANTRRILILCGHPAPGTLNRALCDAYRQGAEEAGHQIRFHDLAQMRFDMDYGRAGYSDPKPLEPDLLRFVEDLEWAQHVVIAAPLWWGAIPAKLKGVFDRALLPGQAFDTRNTNRFGMPKPLLGGRSARVILTADTPGWFLRIAYGNAIRKIMARQILGFVGIRPTRFSHFAPASHAAPEQLREWCETLRETGGRAG